MIKTKQELLESLGAQGILDFILSNLGSTYRDPNLQWGLYRAPSSRSLLVSEGNMQWVEAHCLHSSPVGPVWWAWTLTQGSRKSCDQMKVTLIKTLMQYSRNSKANSGCFTLGVNKILLWIENYVHSQIRRMRAVRRCLSKNSEKSEVWKGSSLFLKSTYWVRGADTVWKSRLFSSWSWPLNSRGDIHVLRKRKAVKFVLKLAT